MDGADELELLCMAGARSTSPRDAAHDPQTLAPSRAKRAGIPASAKGAAPAARAPRVPGHETATGTRTRGRPPVSEVDARSHRVTVRFEPDEGARLTALSAKAGLNESEFIRRAVKGARVVVSKTPETDFAFVRELIAQGNNLNQITRAINRSRGIPAGTVEALDKINALLDAILKRTGPA